MRAAAPVLKDVFAAPAFSQSSAGVGWLKDGGNRWSGLIPSSCRIQTELKGKNFPDLGSNGQAVKLTFMTLTRDKPLGMEQFGTQLINHLETRGYMQPSTMKLTSVHLTKKPDMPKTDWCTTEHC